jgi:hypothetical protein
MSPKMTLTMKRTTENRCSLPSLSYARFDPIKAWSNELSQPPV